ncbi:MAG: hypothetical protein HY674_21235 [Chloroflexi bacterium]|nr:hypothetical protein [Chloroflexota bacterium]
MSTEPNNRMDEMLQAYAKKRREQAEPSFELHPVTRNILQAEAARTFGKTAPEAKGKPAWLVVWWPRLAWGGCVAAAMALGAFILLQNQPAPKRTLQLAKGTDRQAPAESVSGAELPVPRTAESVAEERSGKAGSPAAALRPARSTTESLAPEATTDLSSATPAPKSVPSDSRDTKPALSAGVEVNQGAERKAAAAEPAKVARPFPAEPKPVAIELAKEGERQMTLSQRYGLAPAPAPRGAVTDSVAPGGKPAATALPAAPPAAQPAAMAGGQSDRAAPADAYAYLNIQSNQLRQRFSQVPSPYRRNFNSPSIPNVLNNFQVEQIGRQIRIVDDDGSVYEPQIEAEAAVAMKKSEETAGAQTAIKRRSAAQKAAQTAADTAAATANESGGLFFRVAGTNRTLNQRVFFEGNYLVQTNFPALGVRARTSAAPQAAARQVQSQPSPPTARIQGQAVIGAGNRFEVNAVPIPP